jgi:hypothetical protein
MQVAYFQCFPPCLRAILGDPFNVIPLNIPRAVADSKLQINVVAGSPGMWNVYENMQNAIETELELGSTDYTVIDGQPVKVNTTMAGHKPGTLKVTPVRTGNIVSAEVHYDASPFPDMPKPRSFFLNQRELDSYMLKGPQCVLEEKRN